MANITPAVTSAINAVAAKIIERDPGADLAMVTSRLTALISAWPNCPGGMYGPSSFTPPRASLWITGWFPEMGVDATSTAALKKLFGV